MVSKSFIGVTLSGVLLLLLISFQALAAACVQPPPDMVAWWPFDEDAGTTALDIVGFNDGTNVSNPIQSPGMVGNSLRFDGIDDYVAVPDSDLWAFGTSDFTIEFWANFDVPGSGTIGHPGDVFIGNDEGPFSVNKWFLALGGGILNFHVNGPTSGSFFSPQASFSPIVGQWYHLAVTRIGTNYNIYVDGILSASGANAANIADADAILTIGRALEPFGGFMNGRLDEMTIYHRALAETELQAIVAAGAEGKCKGDEPQIRPQVGGDTGTVTVTITGAIFQEGAEVLLLRVGEDDIIGSPVNLTSNTIITTTFDLTGKAQGLWDVVVENLDGTSVTLANGFTIEEGRAAQVWVDIIGFPAIRLGRPQIYLILYGNRGNTDAVLTHLVFSGIPPDAEVRPKFSYFVTDYDNTNTVSEQAKAISNPEEKVVPAIIPIIPPARTGALGIEITSDVLNAFDLKVSGWTL